MAFNTFSTKAMSFPQESRLEKFIKDFVRKKTAEQVDLNLKENRISVADIRKKKCILLAKFWANVFQHENNYPISSYEYRKNVDDDLLKVTVDKTDIVIDMKTGELVMKGEFVYDWFDQNFWRVLETCDAEFAKGWTYEASEVTTVTVSKEATPLNDYTTDIEKFQLGVSYHGEKKQESLEAKIQSLILPDFRELYFDMVFWSDAKIDGELESLAIGSLKDGFSYVYPLWRSLLKRWLQEEHARVTIATPHIDVDRLSDVGRLLLLSESAKENLDCVYANINTTQKRREVLQGFPDLVKPHLEHFLFNRIVYPVKKIKCGFISCVDCKKSVARVLLTSACFSAESFGCHGNESVVYMEMSETEFDERFIQPNERQLILS
ncbi:hypothetical protein CAPTEDRAFT_225167 [Capitella teleta]|uniref:Uncharacterized protein n=1 Tax=Capitella teleta TaxID=283909 RepID=R7T6B0_CAPTE|nr:hypothetical protein CAPTEDRAFT_225167 [Capitella teleta]|eukprot:ELT88818.1 hypothetical protein CAPTEDRAFT_225167 [Capitella teleta]